MEDVHEEPLFVQRVAGLDIAKAEVEVTIRVPSDTISGRRQQETGRSALPAGSCWA
jgi:transposase